MKTNRSKTFILALCFILIFSCFLSVSCKKSCKDKNDDDIKTPVNTYYVTFDANNGSNTNMVSVEENKTVSMPSSNPTKEGFNFLYWSLNGEEYNFNTPITSHITLVAMYESIVVKTTRIRWNEDESITYEYDGDIPRTVEVGSVIKFKVNESPYFDGDLKVYVNETLVSKASDGYYSFVAEDVSSMDVSVDGLVKQNNKISGSGTVDNPYMINNAAQFKAFTDGVNSTTVTRYNNAYFELNADIDFNGYTIDIIGTTLNENEFSGHFNGNGHTISNFKLKEKNGIFGLFGYLVVAEVSNLNINSDLYATPSNDGYSLIGSLVAYNIGSDIINCSYNGTLEVDNQLDNSAKVFAGGLIGYMQSYTDTYSSSLMYSKVNATIKSIGKTEATSVGGLVGNLFGASYETAAYVYNCAFDGRIEGSILSSGGIVGSQQEKTSVTECYSKGYIEAISNGRITSSGGIVGLCENETVVNYCFSTAELKSNNPDKAEYIIGDIIGSAYPDGKSGLDDRKVLEISNYYANNSIVTVDNVKYDLTKLEDVIKLLNWKKCNWNNDLTPNKDGLDVAEVEIIFDFGRDVTNEGLDGNMLTQSKDTVKVNGCIPVYWVYNGSGQNTFVADDGTISYGYFFDEACTIRVPAAYLISQNETIYVGFADYNNVEGEYYINLSNQEIKLTFDNNGKLTMQYDGIVEYYVYLFDGKKITIKDAYFAQLEYPSLADSIEDDVDYYAIIEKEDLLIYNDDYFPLEDGLEIIAHKKNMAMGKWYSSNNEVYTFLSDGTGNIDDVSTFIYECNGMEVVITKGKEVINATISNDGTSMISNDNVILSITKFDIFTGEWEADFIEQLNIIFDGKGNVIYEGNSYNYTVDGEIAHFDKYSASFNEEGLLELSDGSKKNVFGRKGSFIGTWTDTVVDYWISFGGIGKDGYGYGYDSFGYTFSYILDSDQSGLDGFITMYVGSTMYGYGHMAVGNDGSIMLYLAVFTPDRGMIVDDYNVSYIDAFYGTWHGEDGMSLTFNGLGAYDIYEYIYSIAGYWDVRGFVTVEKDGNETDVRYSYDLESGTGSFEYLGITYNVQVIDGELIVNEVSFKSPDGLDVQQFQIDDKIFTFNGKSKVDLGKVTVTVNNEEVEYSYIVNDKIVEIYDNQELIYTIDTENNYLLVDKTTNEELQLGIYHKLIGKTFVLSNFASISFDGLLNIDGFGKASYISDSEEYELDILYVDQSYLALYQGSTFIYYAYYLNENCAALCDYNFSVVSVMATPDELCGVWYSESGDKVIFDGLTNASEYIYSSCAITETDEVGSYLETYTYEVQDDHYVIYTTENDIEVDKYYVYTSYVEGSVAYSKDDVTIYIVKA